MRLMSGAPVVPDYEDDDHDITGQVIAFGGVRVQQPTASATGTSGGEPKSHSPDRQATAYVAPKAEDIPRRQWLYAHHYLRGIVSATVAPGGFGKTTLSLHDALSMTCEDPGLRVWYISAEDDLDELHRRIAAHFKRHNLHGYEVESRLFVDDKLSFQFKIARTIRNNVIAFDDAALAMFERAIVSAKIDVVILDPFISFHTVPENDTAAMDAVIKRLGEIATRQKCDIELSHHVRKPSAAGPVEITVYDARGAGSIVNAVRSCRVLNQMPKVVAEGLNPPIADKDRCRYIRIDSGKRNMAPPEAAQWMQLHNVQIANGDFVQALDHFEMRVQTTNPDEDRVWLRNVMFKHGGFRTSSQSDNWLGVAMAQHFDRDATNEGDRRWLNKIIKRWEGDGLIKKKDLKDEKRNMRPHWVLGDSVNDLPQTEAVDDDHDDDHGS
jgi:AAA domain